MKCHSPKRSVAPRAARAGLTLVEMMVATTVALMLILGMAQAFAMIGTGMENRRSVLVMSNQVRGVLNQLEEDLQGVTVPLRPWTERGSGQGYFECLEGIGADSAPLPGFNDVSSLFGDVDDRMAFTTRRPGAPFLGQIVLPGPNGVWGNPGDDDGNGVVNDMNEAGWPGSDDEVTVESDVAEVIYQCIYRESDPALDAADAGVGFVSRPDPGQGEITLHRRVLLIRPDLAPGNRVILANSRPDLAQSAGRYVGHFTAAGNSSGDLEVVALHIRRYLAKSDISVRFEFGLAPNSSNWDGRIHVFANSLGDLSRRENRFAHNPVILESGGTYVSTAPGSPLAALRSFPYPMEIDPRNIGGNTYRSITSMQQRELFPDRNSPNPTIQTHYLHYGDQAGETTALSQVLAFDVRVFDPTAQLRASPGADGAWGTVGVDDNGDGINDNALEAGWPTTDDSSALTVQDPLVQAWMATNSGANVAQLDAAFPVIGLGTFVDLGYSRHVRVPFGAVSQFAPVPPAIAPTYDTWTMYYEEDGINQNGNFVNLQTNGLDDNDINGIDDGAEANIPLVDEGLNGLDDDGLNGVDDPGERETAPPYAWPLRGMQVRLRVYDGSTRQVRQGTVSIDFLPE